MGVAIFSTSSIDSFRICSFPASSSLSRIVTYASRAAHAPTSDRRISICRSWLSKISFSCATVSRIFFVFLRSSSSWCVSPCTWSRMRFNYSSRTHTIHTSSSYPFCCCRMISLSFSSISRMLAPSFAFISFSSSASRFLLTITVDC